MDADPIFGRKFGARIVRFVPILTALSIARLGLLIPGAVLFLLPGWILGRMFRTPFAWVTAFLGSAALLFNLFLLLDALRLPLNLVTVGCSFAAVTGALALWATRRRTPLAVPWRPVEFPRGVEWIWLVPPILALVSIAGRDLIEPLSGNDNSFRWDYLARLVLTHHSLASYPPFRMEDFDLYSWCDGIPPLVPFLNYLIYAISGSVAPGLITLRAVGESLLLGSLTYRFGRDLWGKAAGWASVAVLGSCTLLVWGLAIEQETGLTAIALVAMIFFLQHPGGGKDEGHGLVAWAGVASGVGAISREYGLYFVILGAVLVLARRGARNLARFLLPAIAVAAPWYLRNWLKTGNPVFPALGRFFPTNGVHVEIMGDISNFWGFRSSPFPLGEVPLELMATCGAVLVLGGAGLVLLKFRGRGILPAVLMVTALWVFSMPLTAGGWSYSMRVLLPALALGSVLAGWVGAAGKRVRVAGAILLGILSLDAARRSWFLPDFPFTTPWTLSFSEWRALRAQSDRQSSGNVWTVLVKVAGSGFIAVDSPMPFVAVMDAGGHPTPFTSPRFAPALDPKLSVEEAAARLRALNVRFVTFSVRNPVVNKLVQRHATLRELARAYAPVAEINGLLIFDLDFLTPVATTPRPAS
jgi:hypothetical protein